MGYKSHAQRKAVHASKAEQKAKGASMKKYGASKKDFPEIKEKNQGKFTKWVEKNMPGVDTCKAASKIMRSRTKKYSPAVVKMANYANNFGCKTKKEDGASQKKSKGDVKEISAKKFYKKASRNPKKTSSTGTIKSNPFAGTYSRKEKTVVNKKRKRFIAEEEVNKTPKSSSISKSYYKQKKGASFNPKLKQAVADGKIKGKFAKAIMKG